MNQIRRAVFLTLIIAVSLSAALAQRQFEVPFSDLERWSEKVIFSTEAEIAASSKVHRLENDCEMHFAGRVPDYKGDPPSWVFEPMNLCVEPFFGKNKQSNQDWEKFGPSLRGATVTLEGVVRIWPEHLNGKEYPSSPHHAVELHPLSKLTRGNKEYDFTGFIYGPEGLTGISDETAEKIVKNTSVVVRKRENTVEIDFYSGRIGNFAIFSIRVDADSIKAVPGGHKMLGRVVFSRQDRPSVRLATVTGTAIDKRIAEIKAGTRRNRTFSALVLFSVSSGDGGNPSPSGEVRIPDVPRGDEG